MQMEQSKSSLEGESVPMMGPIEDHLRALASERDSPAVSIVTCAVRIDESGPPLRAVLARAADGEPLSADEECLLFRGLHILAARGDRQAFQPLLRLLSRPGDEPHRLLGDVVTETLPKILADLFDGDVDGLFGLVSDGVIDQFVRMAALGAATFLTWESRIEGDRMQRFLEQFYHQRLAEDGDAAWVGWLEAIALLGLRGLAPLVYAAWDEGRVPEDFEERSDFEQDLCEAERAPDELARFERAHLGHSDVDKLVLTLNRFEWNEAGDLEDEADRSLFSDFEQPSAPVTNPWRHVGRNDPCPCGSGKKAKKCCLAN